MGIPYSKLEREIVDSCIEVYLDPETVRKLGDKFFNIDRIRKLMLAKTEVIKSEIYPLVKRGSILDLGCGVSPASILLAMYGFDVISVDANPYFLKRLNEVAKKYGVERNIQLKTGDFEYLPLTDKSVDVTVSFDGLVSKIGLPKILEDHEDFKTKIVREQQKILQQQIEKGLSRKYLLDYELGDQVCIPYSVKAFEEARRVTSKALIVGVSCSNPFCNIFKSVKKIGEKTGFNYHSDVRVVDELFKYMIIK